MDAGVTVQMADFHSEEIGFLQLVARLQGRKRWHGWLSCPGVDEWCAADNEDWCAADNEDWCAADNEELASNTSNSSDGHVPSSGSDSRRSADVWGTASTDLPVFIASSPDKVKRRLQQQQKKQQHCGVCGTFKTSFQLHSGWPLTATGSTSAPAVCTNGAVASCPPPQKNGCRDASIMQQQRRLLHWLARLTAVTCRSTTPAREPTVAAAAP